MFPSSLTTTATAYKIVAKRGNPLIAIYIGKQSHLMKVINSKAAFFAQGSITAHTCSSTLKNDAGKLVNKSQVDLQQYVNKELKSELVAIKYIQSLHTDAI